MSFDLIFMCDVNSTFRPILVIVFGWNSCRWCLDILQEFFWGISYLWEHNIEIPQTWHTGQAHNLSQHKLEMDFLLLLLFFFCLFLIFPVKVLLSGQNKCCLNLNSRKMNWHFLYSAALGLIHVVFNTILLFVVNKAGLILNTREGLETWLIYVHKILWDLWVQRSIGSINWGKLTLSIHMKY